MGAKSRTKIFESLDEEKAADVLEEMEPYAQAQIIESLSIGKAADVLEKMPADEVADLLDELKDEKVELLLNEMEKESSEEVRELLEYEDKEVGSLMTTDYLSFRETMTIEETLQELRLQKPEADMIYSLFITDEAEKLIATVSLRDLVISLPTVTLGDIMNKHIISVNDEDKVNTLGAIISKYDLLAIPVTDSQNTLVGMVVIDDIVEDLMLEGKTKKGGRSWR
jgi:Mg/Co/Ni transporter MgtE